MAIPEGNGRTAGGSGKPSLIAGAPAADGGTPPRAAMRILDGIGSDSGAARRSDRPRARWPMAVALAVLAIGALWWWAGARNGDAATPPRSAAAEPARSSTAAAPATEATPATPATQATQTTPAASPASAGSDSPPSVARIETAPPTVAAAPEASASAVAAATGTVAAPTSRPVVARSATPRTAAPRAGTTAAARPARRPATATASTPTPTIATTTARDTDRTRARTTATRTSTRPTGNAIAAGDPDVALLSAMLARLSNENGTASPATIAQMVEQCEATPLRGAIDSFECRRRICSGYWGKADACPIALAPARAR